MVVKVRVAIHPGEHIAEELEERGMSAAERARAMGVDRGWVSRLVNGLIGGSFGERLGPAADVGRERRGDRPRASR